MKKFMTPEVEVLKFAVEDVITTSNLTTPSEDEEPNPSAEEYCI